MFFVRGTPAPRCRRDFWRSSSSSSCSRRTARTPSWRSWIRIRMLPWRSNGASVEAPASKLHMPRSSLAVVRLEDFFLPAPEALVVRCAVELAHLSLEFLPLLRSLLLFGGVDVREGTGDKGIARGGNFPESRNQESQVELEEVKILRPGVWLFLTSRLRMQANSRMTKVILGVAAGRCRTNERMHGCARGCQAIVRSSKGERPGVGLRLKMSWDASVERTDPRRVCRDGGGGLN